MQPSLSFSLLRPGISSGIRRSCIHKRWPTTCSLWNACRPYYWPYAEDFVHPDGPSPSRIQSSSLPSSRMRQIEDAGLGPLYGERRIVCVLGWNFSPTCPTIATAAAAAIPTPSTTTSHCLPSSSSSLSLLRQRTSAGGPISSAPPHSIRSLMGRRISIRRCLAEFFDTEVENIILGSIKQTKEMMLYRSGLADSPRLMHGPGTVPSRATITENRARRNTINEQYFCHSSSPSSSTSSSSCSGVYDESARIRTFLHSFPSPSSLSPPFPVSLMEGKKQEVTLKRVKGEGKPQEALLSRLAYAPGPIAATVLMEVELAPSPHISPTVALRYGEVLQRYFYSSVSEIQELQIQYKGNNKRNERGNRLDSVIEECEIERKIENQPFKLENHEKMMKEGGEDEEEKEEDVERCMSAVRYLKEVLGARYCEVPEVADCSDYAFQDFLLKNN